jgi:hypothetical protein
LAELEPRSLESSFTRTGEGKDGGVECYIVNPDGTETGWQAKYTWETEGLITQLNTSLIQVLKQHPRLTKFVVCIPYNLSDARGASDKKDFETQRAKWNKWKKANETSNFKIELWDENTLITKLTNDTETYRGFVYYWFNEKILDRSWYRKHFEITKKDLGRRYTPRRFK